MPAFDPEPIRCFAVTNTARINTARPATITALFPNSGTEVLGTQEMFKPQVKVIVVQLPLKIQVVERLTV